MQKKPLISVIMPCYNAEDYIEEAIWSVLNQQGNKDYEIILIDDGSTDNTPELIEKYISYPNITIIELHQNRGIGNARNVGVKTSKGKYIAFLSADDIWKPTFLEQMMKYASKGIVFCQWDIITAHGSNLGIKNKGVTFKEKVVISKKLFKSQVINSAINRGMFVNYSAILGLKKYFIKENKFNDKYRICEDFDHILNICSKAEFTYLSEPLLMYREHKGSMTSNSSGKIWYYTEKILHERGLK